MQACRRHLLASLWLALVAMLALALLPSVGHGLAGPGSGFAEVCTPQGMKLVSLSDGQEQPPPATTHMEHCTDCSAGLNAAALPPMPAAAALPAAAGGDALPPLLLHAPRTLYAWASAQPRGPPATR